MSEPSLASSRFHSDAAAGFALRLAQESDVPALEALIALSTRVLQAPFYSAAQIEAAIGPVFGVDRQLICDGTYFVVEEAGRIVGCGGWSRRRAVYGGDAHRAEQSGALDPTVEPARIRAFFVHPNHARRGIGRALLHACEQALQAAGFREAILVGTLAGEPLYTSAGYTVTKRHEVPIPRDLTLPVVEMQKRFL